MVISAQCPSCGRLARVGRELEGRRVKCPDCKAAFVVALAADRPARGRRPAGPAVDDGPDEAVAASARRRPPRQRDEDDGDDERGRDDEDDRDDGRPLEDTPSRRPAVLAAGAVLLLGGLGVAAYLLGGPAPQPAAPLVGLPAPQPAADATLRLDMITPGAVSPPIPAGRTLEVTAVVSKAQPFGAGALSLRGPGETGAKVTCVFTPAEAAKAAGLRRGQVVTVRGVCGVAGPAGIDIGGCVLVRASEPPPNTEPSQSRPAPPTPTPAPAVRPTWLDPSTPATNSFGLRFHFEGAEVGPVVVRQRAPLAIPFLRLKGGNVFPCVTRDATTSGRYLALRLRVVNGSTRSAYNYVRPRKGEVKLTDENGNTFADLDPARDGIDVPVTAVRPTANDTLLVRGQTLGTALGCGESVADLLAFDAQNLGKGRRLFFELAGRVGGDDTPIRFEIPQSSVREAATTPPDAADPDAEARAAAVAGRWKGLGAKARAGAAEELGGIAAKSPSAARVLCSALLDPEPGVRAAASSALAKARPDLHSDAITLAVGNDYQARLAAVRRLEGMGGRAGPTLPLLVRFANQTQLLDPRTYEAGNELGAGLHVGVRERDGVLAVQAVVAAGSSDKGLAEQLATWLLTDANAGVRSASAASLLWAEGGKDYAQDAAAALRSEPEASVRVLVARVLGAMGRDARHAAGDLAGAVRRDPSDAVRASAAWALGECGSSAPAVVAALSAATTDPVESVRAAATKALARVRDVPPDGPAPAPRLRPRGGTPAKNRPR